MPFDRCTQWNRNTTYPFKKSRARKYQSTRRPNDFVKAFQYQGKPHATIERRKDGRFYMKESADAVVKIGYWVIISNNDIVSLCTNETFSQHYRKAA